MSGHRLRNILTFNALQKVAFWKVKGHLLVFIAVFFIVKTAKNLLPRAFFGQAR